MKLLLFTSLMTTHVFGLALILLVAAGANNDGAEPTAASYFPNLTSDEKEGYTNWLVDHSSVYPRHAFLPSSDDSEGAAIFWNIDGDIINLAIAVRAEGWVGFGLAEAGGMLGADMVLYEAATSELTDAHVLEDRAMPLTDDCQDWKLNAAMHSDDDEGGWIIVEMNRLLETKDAQDRDIKNDSDLWIAPTRVIAAWGDGDSVSYHGTNVARSAVRLYSDSNESELEGIIRTMEQNSDAYFEIREENHEIAAKETEYHYLCKTFSDLNIDLPEGQIGVTSIGAVPVITEETAQFVHHFLVYRQKECTNGFSLQRQLVYAWAPGDEGWTLPDDVGLPIFQTESDQALSLEIHYNNPSRVSGKKDSSGIRFYFSNSKRTHDAAMLELGDPWVTMSRNGQQDINDGLTQYQFDCPGTCSSTFLGSEPVTVFLEALHMHKTGTRMKQEVIRDGSVFHTAIVDVYDFDQQGAYRVQQESYEILPGDAIRTTCYYRDGEKFGISSDEEMCIGYMLYYPAKKFLGFPWICALSRRNTACTPSVENFDLSEVDELERMFGGPSAECDAETGISPTVGNVFVPESSEDPTGLPTKSPTDSPTKSPVVPIDIVEKFPNSEPITVPYSDEPTGPPIESLVTPEPTDLPTKSPVTPELTDPPTRSPLPATTANLFVATEPPTNPMTPFSDQGKKPTKSPTVSMPGLPINSTITIDMSQSTSTDPANTADLLRVFLMTTAPSLFVFIFIMFQ